MKYVFKRASAMLVALLLLSFTASAQFTVTGTVTDASDQPLIGVSIVIKGTTQGTVTDFDGNFTLEVPGEEGTLMFSYTGFKTTEVVVSSSNNVVNLEMAEDIARLEEVVVTGLASGVKRANSGVSVASISGDELSEKTNPQTLDNALYGKIPGVQITASDGAPGGGINVQLRGVSTLGNGSSQPLYIIDGVYVDNSKIDNGRNAVNSAGGSSQDGAANRIADINPDDIERIEVLKGPSAAAIYGTRANAGVIIITTKRGKAGETRVSLSQDIGYAQGQNFIGFEGWDEAKIRTFFSGARVDTELARYNAAVAEGRVTDWEEFFYGETPLLSNTNLSISGGSQKTQFYVSGGIQSEDGIIKNTGFDRYSVRANIDHQIFNGVKISLNNNYVRSQSQRGFTGNQNNTGGSIGYNIAYAPSYADFFPNEDGSYPNNPYFNDNPIAIRDLGTNDETVDRFISAANIDIDIWQSTNSFLKAKINGGLDYLSGNTLVHFPEILQHQQAQANPGDVTWGRQDIFNYNIQAFLTFNTTFANINSNTTVGAVRLDRRAEQLLARGRALSFEQVNLNWAGVQSIQAQQSQTVTDVGFVAQQDFNWDDKVIASLGIRLDKSTLNAQQDEYYAFPKASLALNLANFDFWNIRNTVNQFKLRAAYGETGGLPNFGVTFEALASQVVGGSLGAQLGTRGVDPNLVPETAAEFEVGLDAAFLNDRISLEFTYYNKAVNNLIEDLTPASSTGITAVATNAADLENRGIEIGLGANPVRSSNINWFTKVLYWQNRSEITNLRIPAKARGGFGTGLGTYLLFEDFSPTAIVGTPNDANGPLGLTVYGDRQPDFQMSWFNQITLFKNFDFSVLFHYQNGGSAINLSAFLWDGGGTAPDWSQDDDNDGTPNGRDRADVVGRPGAGRFIQPTDYLKLREIGLYYTLPDGALGSLVKRAKVGVSGNNLLLSTKYGGYDPETSSLGVQAIASGIDITPYPSSRRLFFHLKLDF